MTKKIESSEVCRIFSLPKSTKVTQEMVKRLDDLLSFSPPGQMRQSLLTVYLQYIIDEHDVLPIDFEDIATDFWFLIEFFNTAEKELKG